MMAGKTGPKRINGLEALDGVEWIETIVTHPKEPETLYLGVARAPSDDNPILYRSIDGAESWITAGLLGTHGRRVQTLAIDTLNNRMYAGTNRGIYVHDFELNIDDNDVQLPQKFLLASNYPNPFNPTTTIRYGLPESSDVSVIVYDITGREVIQLVDSRVPAGNRRVVWNGRDRHGNPVASGLYIYRLVAKSNKTKQIFTQSNKMVLMK